MVVVGICNVILSSNSSYVILLSLLTSATPFNIIFVFEQSAYML